MTKAVTDEALLHLLAEAFPPDPAPPTDALMASLRSGIKAQFDGLGVARPARTPRRWRPRARLTAVVGSVTLVLSSAGAVYALSGSDVPTPIRSVAHAVGMPVDSPALVDVHTTERRLELAIAAHDLPAIKQASSLLRQRMAGLDPSEARSAAKRARDLLEQSELIQSGPHETTDDQRGSAPATPQVPAPLSEDQDNEQPAQTASDRTPTGRTNGSGSVERPAPETPTTMQPPSSAVNEHEQPTEPAPESPPPDGS